MCVHSGRLLNKLQVEVSKWCNLWVVVGLGLCKMMELLWGQLEEGNFERVTDNWTRRALVVSRIDQRLKKDEKSSDVMRKKVQVEEALRKTEG